MQGIHLPQTGTTPMSIPVESEAPPLNQGMGEDQMLPIQDDAITSRPPGTSTGSRNIGFFLVVLLAFLTFFPNLGAFGLWDPWETHYGEVTRNMVETHNWVSPKWGYEGRTIGERPAETGPFLSKPVLIFWMEAISIRTFGFSEWSFRFSMALLAFSLVLMVYRTIWLITRNAWSSSLAALVLATCPQFFLISRQAQTDMPFVGTMSIGLLFLMTALFQGNQKFSDRTYWRKLIFTFLALVALIVPQLIVVATDVQMGAGGRNTTPMAKFGLSLWKNGIYHSLVYGIVAIPVLGGILWPSLRIWKSEGAFDSEFKDHTNRKLNLYLFYACIGLATLAKGLLGFLLPGALIFLFIVVTWNWKLLARVELLRGTGVFLLVTLPWYVAMFSVHGMAFYSRFFVHDHFNRFASGVHQVDTGLFEHFIKWLGLGIFPWTGLVPLVLIPLFLLKKTPRSRIGQFHVFLFIWTFFSYFLFTKSSTKFHHYIFPALPPLAVLIGIWLSKLSELPAKSVRLAATLLIGLTLSLGWTIHDDWQALRNLMTYKYDRPMPENLPIDPDDNVAENSKTTWGESRFFKETPSDIQLSLTSIWGYHPNVIRSLSALVIACGVAWLIFPIPSVVGAGTIGITLAAWLMALWSLNVYMPMLSPAWSQKYIFDEYYDRCTVLPNPSEIEDVYNPIIRRAGLDSFADAIGARTKQVCEEDIISWLFTWRGETFYSNNEILPVAKTAHLKDYLTEFNDGKAFYAVVESHRESSFGTTLNREHRGLKKEKNKKLGSIDKWNIKSIHSENPYFVLVHAVPQYKKK